LCGEAGNRHQVKGTRRFLQFIDIEDIVIRKLPMIRCESGEREEAKGW
jgi:hypothetical protein